MASGNQVTVTGNLTGVPEAKTFPSGSQKVRVGIAWNQNVKQDDGSWETVAHFFNLEAWGPAGRTLLKFTKGDLATVYGRLDWHSWETNEGQHREAVVILVDAVFGEKMYEKAAPDVAGGGSNPNVEPSRSSRGSAKGSGNRPRPKAAPDPGPIEPGEAVDDGIPW